MDIPSDFPLARYIDQTRLKPVTTVEELTEAARRTVEMGFAAFCIPPYQVRRLAPAFQGTRVALQTVIGFPLGFQTPEVKVFEAETAVRHGAQEIDMVINRGWVRSGRDDLVEAEIRAVVEAVKPAEVKTILETSDLSIEEILRVCDVIVKTGAAFIKTSTGFFGQGAEIETVKQIKSKIEDRIKVKASGGIRNLAEAWAFIQAGAERIGTSSGEEIMAEFFSGSGK